MVFSVNFISRERLALIVDLYPSQAIVRYICPFFPSSGAMTELIIHPMFYSYWAYDVYINQYEKVTVGGL